MQRFAIFFLVGWENLSTDFFFILQAQLIFETQQSIYRLTDGVEN